MSHHDIMNVIVVVVLSLHHTHLHTFCLVVCSDAFEWGREDKAGASVEWKKASGLLGI